MEVNSRDELGTLPNNFNKMAQVIEVKINELEGSNVEKQRFIATVVIDRITGEVTAFSLGKATEDITYKTSPY